MSKLTQDIQKKQKNWNERSMFTLKGVRNLSMSDLDTLILYDEHYNGYEFVGLMKPRGYIAQVLSAYGYKGVCA